jgi:hypothetical protein
MKKDRLLEIIREEISEALNVLVTNKKGETTTMPFNTPDEKKSVTNLKTDSNITNIETTAGQNIKEGEKRKKLAEKYQLDEETINEMASIKQLKSELARQGKEAELKAVTNAERAALDTLKADPTITSDGRLKGYVPTLKKELLNTHNIKLQDLLSKVAGKAEDDGVKFSSDIATNTIEKDAANQLTGKEPGQRGRKADPNKPEKLASTGKKGRPAGEPKAKVATRTPGDDGFDKVEYSDVDGEDKEATQNIGSDSTAKELGKEADVSKNPDFDRIRKGLQNKRKNSKDGILSPEDMKLAVNIINTAKDKYKFNTTQVDSLRADIGL